MHPSEKPSKDEMKRDAHFLARAFLPPPGSATTRPVAPLPLPLCLPQLNSTYGSPFVRAYSPVLEAVDISQVQLLNFIDGLNAAITSSPPLRVVNWTGLILGFLPYNWALWGGLFIQIAAETGDRVLSKSLTDRYLRAANRLLFNPRGLSIRLFTPSALQHMVLMQPEPPKRSRLDRFGRATGTILLTQLPLSFVSKIVHKAAKQPPRVDASDLPNLPFKAKLLPTMRRLVMLEGHALMPLIFDVPPPLKPEGLRTLVQTWGVRLDRWWYGKTQTRAEKQRYKLSEMERMLEVNEDESEKHAPTKKEKKKRAKLERQVSDADLLEHWASDQVLWIVITGSEVDEHIDGIEMADTDEDDEAMELATWDAQMKAEQHNSIRHRETQSPDH
uniref:Uncharacterized protein n=2 Tax=Mycena chlorophos TaxID=658473 RepID=A0ABQ0M7H4_MYCCL|nr:predicted protein [Mycena chlorophos]